MIEQERTTAHVPEQQLTWTPRLAVELLSAQLNAIDSWNLARAASADAVLSGAESREQMLEAGRRLDALKRERAALLARADAALGSGRTWLQPSGPTAVIAHRQEWFRERVAEQLEAQGGLVLASVDDGADAVATALYEQPDLLIAEELLPTLTGLEVIQRVRAFAPGTAIAMQSPRPESVEKLLEAGAALVCSRRIPPAEVVLESLGCLQQREPSRVLV